MIWRGPKKNGLIKQLLRDVDWGGLDFLLVDTPPGTSDEHLSLVQFMAGAGLDGAVIVTTPQEISLQDVRKEINFCEKVGLKVLGVVENMSQFVCPKCQFVSTILPTISGGAEKLRWTFELESALMSVRQPSVLFICDSQNHNGQRTISGLC